MLSNLLIEKLAQDEQHISSFNWIDFVFYCGFKWLLCKLHGYSLHELKIYIDGQDVNLYKFDEKRF